MNKTECKNYQCYMFACEKANIIVEAIDKSNAIEIFKEEYSKIFNQDWKVFCIHSRIDIKRNQDLF
jgi:hypothetical protein